MPAAKPDADRLAYFYDSRVSDLLAIAALNGEVPKGCEVPAGLRERVRAAALV